jgi:osmoprotectant transport system ATP-binding protein
LGYVIQSVGLFPHWTVAENVATVPRLLRWPRKRIDDRVDELLALLALAPETFRDRYPHQLSGGQQQRVGVARALAADPHALLMDEPFGALDAVTRGAMQAEMVRIHKATGKTVLLVTHDVDEAIRLASRIAVMEGGRLVQYARPEEILAAPANAFVSALFGGEAASLRLLKVRRVGDWLEPGVKGPRQTIGPGETLENALARMLADGLDALTVTDASGPKGVIRLADLVRRAR